MKPLWLCQGPRVKLGSAQNPEQIMALSGKENTAPTKPIPQLKLHTPCCTVKSSGSQLTGKNPVMRNYAQAPERSDNFSSYSGPSPQASIL